MDNEIVVIAKGPDTIPSTHPAVSFEMKPVTIPQKPGIDLGIEETKEVVQFGIALANGIVKTLGDGKVTVSDIPNFISAVMKLPAALNGLEKVPAELDNLTDSEVTELIKLVQDNIEIDDENAKEIVQLAINAVYADYELIKAFKKNSNAKN